MFSSQVLITSNLIAIRLDWIRLAFDFDEPYRIRLAFD